MTLVVTRRPWLLAAVLALLLVTLGCKGGQATSGAPATSATASGQQSPAANVPTDSAVAYFHEQLVVNGEDIQSDFGGDLLALGMNPRDLQQDTPEHAYQTVLQRVRDVQDPTQRREMARTFFGTETPR